jgi:hypothetical protein
VTSAAELGRRRAARGATSRRSSSSSSVRSAWAQFRTRIGRADLAGGPDGLRTRRSPRRRRFSPPFCLAPPRPLPQTLVKLRTAAAGLHSALAEDHSNGEQPRDLPVRSPGGRPIGARTDPRLSAIMMPRIVARSPGSLPSRSVYSARGIYFASDGAGNSSTRCELPRHTLCAIRMAGVTTVSPALRRQPWCARRSLDEMPRFWISPQLP